MGSTTSPKRGTVTAMERIISMENFRDVQPKAIEKQLPI